MSLIKWVKTKKGSFPIIVVEHEKGTFYAHCLYHEGNRILKPVGEPGFLKIELKTEYGKKEEEALQQIIKWVKKRYGNDIKWNELSG